MADLKVLQLINDNTAVALNYGVFRRKDINATAQVGWGKLDGAVFRDNGLKTKLLLIDYVPTGQCWLLATTGDFFPGWFVPGLLSIHPLSRIKYIPL